MGKLWDKLVAKSKDWTPDISYCDCSHCQDLRGELKKDCKCIVNEDDSDTMKWMKKLACDCEDCRCVQPENQA